MLNLAVILREVHVWDANSRPLPPGREHLGEFATRGFHTMRGYQEELEASAEAFASDRFHAGDLGYVDADGYYFIVDRKKELIIRGGYDMYPREVEEVLHQHPDVVEAAVGAVPDYRLGQQVKAFVVTLAGSVVAAAELIAYCRQRPAAYKSPRYGELRDALPINGAGKVLKETWPSHAGGKRP